MSTTDELLERLDRIYVAINQTVDGDLPNFRPKVFLDEKSFGIFQDFLGGLTSPQISNLAHAVLHNIAHLQDHLKRWAKNNGCDPKHIDQAVAASGSLQIVKDLSNNDKHGYPPRDGGHSGKAPKLAEVMRIMRLTTRSKPGSFVSLTLTSSGWKQHGDGSSAVVITGRVVDTSGAVLGDLHDICVEAVTAWEQELKVLGIIL